MEGTGTVEEFEVEGRGGLAVEFVVWGGLHCHCVGWDWWMWWMDEACYVEDIAGKGA